MAISTKDINDPKPLIRQAVAIIVIAVLGFFIWASFTYLARGAHISGKVVVESSSKTIQHREGGIVHKIYVSEGQLVEQGQLLLVLEKVAAQAGVDENSQRFARDLMAEARIIAEISGATEISFPPIPEYVHVPSSVLDSIKRDQREIFERRQSHSSAQHEQAKAKFAQIQAQIRGNLSAIEGVQRNLELLDRRINALGPLVADGLFARNQYLEIEATRARTVGDLASRKEEDSRLREALAEAAQTRSAMTTQQRQILAEQLNDTRARLIASREQMKVQKDSLNRTKILAPVTGQVFGLVAHTEGGVITPGQVLMTLVPIKDRLVIEASVNSLDIDVVHSNMTAEIRFLSLPHRISPLLKGKLLSISRDVTDQPSLDSGKAMQTTGFYRARIEVGPAELSRLKGVEIVPGMPVEILLNAGERRVIEYLIAPWADLFSKAMRED